MNRPTHAHFSVTRLGGVNEKVPVTYSGKSAFMTDPQIPGIHYRINAEKFIAGDHQFRDTWAIRKWDERAEQMATSERNWQT